MQPTGEEDTLRTYADEDRLTELLAADPALWAAMPDPAAAAVIRDASTPLHRQIEAVLTTYADRPALADRATEPVLDAATGRTTRRLLPRYDTITYLEVLSKGLAVIDATSIAMCRDNKLPILVFNLNTNGNIMRMSMGEPVGTVIH